MKLCAKNLEINCRTLILLDIAVVEQKYPEAEGQHTVTPLHSPQPPSDGSSELKCCSQLDI